MNEAIKKPCQTCGGSGKIKVNDTVSYPCPDCKPQGDAELVEELNKAIDKVVIAFCLTVATESFEIVTEYSRQLIAKGRAAADRIAQLQSEKAEQARQLVIEVDGAKVLAEALAHANRERKALKQQIAELQATPRCPCGGKIEADGVDIKAKKEVWQCAKCQTQITVAQAKLKEKSKC